MERTQVALLVTLLAVASARAQLLEPVPGTELRAGPSAPMRTPSFPRFYAGSEGLPPADPLALDIYRADPKLFAGVDLNSQLGIETTFTNPNYREGLRYRGFGPRLAQGEPLGVGGFNLDVAARLTVPIDDRLSVFGKLGVAAVARKNHAVSTVAVDPAASVGATYKMNKRQTATVEAPLGNALRVLGGGYGASVKLGF